MKTTKERVEEMSLDLESMIDETSLAYVLALAEAICHEKAAHLQANWADHESAKVWTKAARQIEKIVSTMDI